MKYKQKSSPACFLSLKTRKNLRQHAGEDSHTLRPGRSWLVNFTLVNLECKIVKEVATDDILYIPRKKRQTISRDEICRQMDYGNYISTNFLLKVINAINEAFQKKITTKWGKWNQEKYIIF